MRASIPANGPIPTQTEKMIAQMSGSIDRAKFEMNLTVEYMAKDSGLPFIKVLALKKLNMKEGGRAIMVAVKAI